MHTSLIRLYTFMNSFIGTIFGKKKQKKTNIVRSVCRCVSRFHFFKRMGGSEKSRFLSCRVVVDCNRLLAAARCTWDLLGLLWQKNGLDVWQYTTLGDGDTRQQFVQLLVVADGQLQMTGNDASLLVVAGSVAGQLEHFGCQVFHDGGQVDWCTGTDAFCVVALAQQTVDATDRELQTSAA